MKQAGLSSWPNRAEPYQLAGQRFPTDSEGSVKSANSLDLRRTPSCAFYLCGILLTGRAVMLVASNSVGACTPVRTYDQEKL